MKKYIILFLLPFISLQQGNTQIQLQEELKAYNDYIISLSCYKESAIISTQISEQYMKGDIQAVRKLSAKREKLLLQTIDSVMRFRPNSQRNETTAQIVTRLAFNLNFENTEKVLNLFDSNFKPECLQKLRENQNKERSVRPGMPAPNFKLFDKEGKVYTLDSFPGKYIFLEFSASWCGWCKKEIPAIRKAYERFKNDVIFITVHLDDNQTKWLKDLKDHPVPWYCLSDLKAWESPVAEAYHINGVPNCFVISPNHLIKAKELRGIEIENTIEKLLAENKGISFRTETFSEILKQAHTEKKLIFIDCYTSWCAPCKMMNTTVFTQPEIGDFFNTHFVNVKFDMEKGEGKELIKRYKIEVFPTYLLLDYEGNEVHRVVGGHDPYEFIELIRNGMDSQHSISGLQEQYNTGKRDTTFLREYITALGRGYRYDKIPEILDIFCQQLNGKITESDWELIKRYTSNPSSYTFHFIAENRQQLQQYTKTEKLEDWIQKILYTSVFNTVNDAIFNPEKHNEKKIALLRKSIEEIQPIRKDFLLAILDYYEAFYQNKINKALSIYQKKFIDLPSSDRFGLTLQLNAMLYTKGNKAQCQKGLQIFQQILKPNDPLLKNFENTLNKRINEIN